MNPVYSVLIAVAVAMMALAPSGATAQSARPQVQATATNPLAAQTLDRLSATRERPLFSAKRRAPSPARVAAAPPPPPPPPPQPPQVALYGIVTEENGARAMIRANGDKIVSVRVGDDVAGWTVTKIERRLIELSLDQRAVSVAMFSGAAAGKTEAAESEQDEPEGPPEAPQTRSR